MWNITSEGFSFSFEFVTLRNDIVLFGNTSMAVRDVMWKRSMHDIYVYLVINVASHFKFAQEDSLGEALHNDKFTSGCRTIIL